jgi:hypothetical protein
LDRICRFTISNFLVCVEFLKAHKFPTTFFIGTGGASPLQIIIYIKYKSEVLQNLYITKKKKKKKEENTKKKGNELSISISVAILATVPYSSLLFYEPPGPFMTKNILHFCVVGSSLLKIQSFLVTQILHPTHYDYNVHIKWYRKSPSKCLRSLSQKAELHRNKNSNLGSS